MLIEKVSSLLEAKNIPYALVGGHAVALYGAVRGTVDVDFVIEWQLDILLRTVNVLESLGLRSSLPVTAREIFEHRETYIREKNLIAWNFVNFDNPLEQVDLLINYDLKGHEVTKVDTVFGKIRVLNKLDLIQMKRESGRPQDLEDVRALESL